LLWIKENLVKGRYICESGDGGCTHEGGDTWASGKHIGCCSGLKENLVKGRYICEYEGGGGCQKSQYGCCPDGVTSKTNPTGTNCSGTGGGNVLDPCHGNDNNIFVPGDKGGAICTSRGKHTYQYSPYFNTCNGKDITLRGTKGDSCIYRSTKNSSGYSNLDLNKVKQIDFDVSAKDCEKDWAAIWLDPHPYKDKNNSATSGEIDMIEIISGHASHNFGGCNDGKHCRQAKIANPVGKNFKKHITLRSDNGYVTLNNCDGDKPCSYNNNAFIDTNKVGTPGKTYTFVADIFKSDGSKGTTSSSGCELTMKNLKVHY